MATIDSKRRQFLGLMPKATRSSVRPPWSINESSFLDACSRCGDCLDACSENILIREGPNGYPIVDFMRGECTFCGDCVTACPTDALSKNLQPAWSVKANITASCLLSQQVICRTCGEQCEAEAIFFPTTVAVLSPPIIQLDLCTGCGACVAPCPSRAIEVFHV